MEILENLKYPIGKFQKPTILSENQLKIWTFEIESFPKNLKAKTINLSIMQINWQYRPNGWSIKQVVHHCADSHINAYIRFKLAFTQVLPVINPFDESKWAELIDGNDDAIGASISIIEGLHNRWAIFLKTLTFEDLKKEYFHPGNNENVSIETAIGMYAWHCNHHLAHIEQAISNKGNFKTL